MVARHERAFLDERKKFSTFLKFPWSTRSRANRRIDSQMDSSGANTPDPTSPAPETQAGVGDQEVGRRLFLLSSDWFFNFYLSVRVVSQYHRQHLHQLHSHHKKMQLRNVR